MHNVLIHLTKSFSHALARILCPYNKINRSTFFLIFLYKYSCQVTLKKCVCNEKIVDDLASYSYSYSYLIGQDNSKGSGFFFVLYKTFLICWISFGLGYTVMIMTFIARGMRSKKITRIEHKLAINLKHTQSKIWNEFNKEINYLRRAFNELQLSKVKVNEIAFLILYFDLSRLYAYLYNESIFL